MCCYSLQYSMSTEEEVQMKDNYFNHKKSCGSRHNCQCPTTLLKHLKAIFHDINLSLNKSDASLFPLKQSLSSPGIERPPSNPPNPEVIVAGRCPTWLCSRLKYPSGEVYADSIQITDSKFPCGPMDQN